MAKQRKIHLTSGHPAMLVACLVGVAGFIGCGTTTDNSIDPISGIGPAADPLPAIRRFVRQRKWADAWELKDELLATRPRDAEALMLIAKVAHANQKPSSAADFLKLACESESYTDASHVTQATVGMIGAGRLFDAIELLTTAVELHPDQHSNRRWLYDFLLGVEDHRGATRHGRYLVRQRQFDVDLLLSMSNHEARRLESQPLLEMSKLNPTDRRPLIGLAKKQFDKQEFDEAEGTLRDIIDSHQGFTPAHALRCLTLSRMGRTKAFQLAIDELPPGIENEVSYWLAIGDESSAERKPSEAARAYWEATRLDDAMVEPLSKLIVAIDELETRPSPITDEIFIAMKLRLNRLERFNRDRARFRKAGKISRELAHSVSTSLMELGRLWEAEAWASIALSLPDDHSVSIEKLRESIVTRLRRETPWQQTDAFPELTLDLSSLAKP